MTVQNEAGHEDAGRDPERRSQLMMKLLLLLLLPLQVAAMQWRQSISE